MKILISVLVLLTLSGCNGGVPSLSFPGVYKLDIPQGNVITQDMVDQLRPGLTKRQVNFILGTPLIKDTFDQDRWDYVYNLQLGGQERAGERISIFFDNNAVTHFSGDFQQSPEKVQFEQAESDTQNN